MAQFLCLATHFCHLATLFLLLACLQALCYLSVCILPSHAITRMLDIVEKIARSESCKTKMSLLEFLQVTVFTNFPSVAQSVEHRTRVTELVLSLLQDEHITVR